MTVKISPQYLNWNLTCCPPPPFSPDHRGAVEVEADRGRKQMISPLLNCSVVIVLINYYCFSPPPTLFFFLIHPPSSSRDYVFLLLYSQPAAERDYCLHVLVNLTFHPAISLIHQRTNLKEEEGESRPVFFFCFVF